MSELTSSVPPSDALPAPQSYPVLVVEDDEAIGGFVKRALSDNGYRVTRFLSAEAALDRLSGNEPLVFLVDKNLPGMSGIEFIRQLRKRRDTFEAILMTAYADVDSLLMSLELGVYQCLRKPFQLSELQATVAGAASRLFLRLDRRARMQELERRNEELDRALSKLKSSESKRLLSERLASMGQFAAALGHEINNPLACVHTNFTLLRETVVALSGAVRQWQAGTPWAKLEERLRRDVLRVTIEGPDILDECEAALALMRQVSDDLRAVTRYRTDSVERFDLNEVVRTACRVARLEPRLGTKMRIELPAAPIRVHGSPGRMAQVVMNLVANAAEATDAKRPNKITVRSFTTETYAVLEVEDTGVGIASDHLDTIFEPFVTYRREQGGTGIGLGIVWQVVEEHGGRVEVVSQVGIGSTFRALLPLPRPSPAPTQPSERPRELPRGLRILLVEDNALVRQSMVRAFPEQHVTAVANGQEAVDAIERQSPDVVVTDLAMPELDGIELYRRIVERWPFLARRILFVSGTDSLIERARRALPSLPLLRKPFPVRELHMMLLEVYESSAAGRAPQ